MYSETKIIVRYAETDQMGIAHHSNYPVWYEMARTELVKNQGMTYLEMENQGVMTPLIELNCKYIAPACYDDELTIRVRAGKLTPVRITFEYEIYKEDKLINTGSTTHVLTNKNLKPINVKKENPEMYNFLLNIMGS